MHQQLRLDFDRPAPVPPLTFVRSVTLPPLPPPAESSTAPSEEVDALIAEAAAIEARIDAGAATAADRAALRRIGARADALGYIGLGTHTDWLVSAMEWANG